MAVQLRIDSTPEISRWVTDAKQRYDNNRAGEDNAYDQFLTALDLLHAEAVGGNPAPPHYKSMGMRRLRAMISKMRGLCWGLVLLP